MEELNWKLVKFDDLSVHELYEVLRLRAEVFVIEQNCIYEDHDNKDQKCHHLMGYSKIDGKLIVYSRLVPPGVSYTEPSIGRVLTSLENRKNKYGIALLNKSIAEITKIYPNTNIRIGAQTYLIRFYNSFGFVEQGEPYDEDGIEHIEMLLHQSVH